MFPLTIRATDVAQAPHGLHHTIDRPHGSGDFVFVHFHTPMEIRTRDGLVNGEPGDCILYSPKFPQWFRGRGVGFRDDWIHMLGPSVPKLLSRYALSANTLLRPRDTRFVAPCIREIKREMLHRQPYWQESVAGTVESLMRQLARSLAPHTPPNAADTRHLSDLRDVRVQVHDRITERWSVAAMSRQAHLSPSRFAALYLKCFGVSPIEDLIRARLERAQWHLSTSNLSVGEVAHECGFTNVYYFSRLFRRRTDVPPSRFAKNRNGL